MKTFQIATLLAIIYKLENLSAFPKFHKPLSTGTQGNNQCCGSGFNGVPGSISGSRRAKRPTKIAKKN
jgi:hypothetical protein